MENKITNKPKTQVNDKMEAIDRAISDYSEALSLLTKRIEDITRQEQPFQDDCCERETLVPLADALDIKASRIRALNCELISLTQRIEL